ncbi:MAG: thioesterase [Planctomycetes bacterium]|nr:thioesterase [Planctomycetota bacterium]
MTNLTPGLQAEAETTVTAADTAERWASGSVPVYSTPALVGLMERTAVLALAGQLPAGQTTVGSRIDVRHLAATPVGMRVRAVAQLVAVDGRKLVFRIEAFDAVEKVGEATHERAVVVQEQFLQRVQQKRG